VKTGKKPLPANLFDSIPDPPKSMLRVLPEFKCPHCEFTAPSRPQWHEKHEEMRPSCGACGCDLTLIKAIVPKLKPDPMPCPWYVSPPQSLPERQQAIEDVQTLLADHKINYEEFSRFLIVSCYVLSGLELAQMARFFLHVVKGESDGN
jgi:hypothetical protein